MSEDNVFHLHKVRQKKEEELRKLEAEALLEGVDELRQFIQEGKVAGVAFAVEYVDGDLGTHHFTTNDHMARLLMATTILAREVEREAMYGPYLEDDEEEVDEDE